MGKQYQRTRTLPDSLGRSRVALLDDADGSVRLSESRGARTRYARDETRSTTATRTNETKSFRSIDRWMDGWIDVGGDGDDEDDAHARTADEVFRVNPHHGARSDARERCIA